MEKRKKIIISVVLISILVVITIVFLYLHDNNKSNTLTIYTNAIGDVITHDEIQYEDLNGKIYTYNCKTKDCKVIGSSNKMVIISDGFINTYDLENNEITSLNIDGKYNNVEIIQDENLKKIYGYVFSYKDENALTSNCYLGSLYYSLDDNKYYLKNQYDYINLLYSENFIKYGLLVGVKIFDNKQKQQLSYQIPYLVDYKTGDIKIKGLKNGTFYIDENFIYVWDGDDFSKLYIYNHKYEKITNNMISEYINDDDTIYVNEKKEITRYDKNGNVLKNMTGYNNIRVLTKNNDDIYFVDELNNKLDVYDFNGNKIYELVMEKSWNFHPNLSGYSKNGDKEGIFLVIEDNSVEYGEVGAGLEYWYNPKTKENGVIKTKGIESYEKPVLYLYPTSKTDVTVSFENDKLLTTTYPKYLDKWQVTAYSDGSLYDKNNNYYYALYWEESSNKEVDFKEGFYVTKDNAISFLEEKLALIGLNNQERNEFIMYWLPILEKNEKNLVYFELTEERQSSNKLIISPNPDSLLRVSMHVKKVGEQVEIKEQELKTFKRRGFVAVEWGGKIHS